jgi:uncharacterized protein (TIGR02996 family)
MTTLDSKLQGIIDNPADNRLRLEYADLLDHEGNHDRAEYIRLACWLENGNANARERAKVKERAGQLLEKHEKTWSQPLLELSASFESESHLYFRRGFVEEIALTADDFLTHAHEIFARAPIQVLAISNAKTRVQDLAQCPFFARLEVLIFRSRRYPLEPSDINVIVQSPYLTNVIGLGLGGNYIMDEGAGAIAASPELKNLKRLFLNEGMISDQGVQHLSTSPYLTSLRVLNLQGNFIGNEGAMALIASSNLRSLEELYLDSWSEVFDPDHLRNPIGPEWQKALLDHFGARVCSFSTRPDFKASLIG